MNAMNRIYLNIMACVATLLPMLAQAAVNIEHWVAPSGARVYFVASHALPMLDVKIDFSAGGAFDPEGKSGVASLTGSLLDSGTKLGETVLDEEQIAEKLADIAAHLSASTDLDRASLSLRTLTSKTEREAALALMRAVLTAPSFPADILEREKARSIAAIQEADTRPDSIVAKRFAAAAYPHHPYGISSTVASVGRISRDDLVAFWRAHFGARRAVVSIIGDISRAEAEAIATQLTDALPETATETPAQLPAVTLPARETIRLPHPATQSHILIGMPTLKRTDADYFPLLVGNYALGGGGFVSRLMKEVREKRGYAYSVYSYFDPHKLEGPFEIGLQTKREQTGEALKVVESTLTAFLKDGPTAAELKAAQQNLIDGLALKLDSNAKILNHLSLIGFYELPLNYLDDYPRRIAAVTAQQVREAFARHVQAEHLVTVIVAAD
jgi:zinc protease